MFDLTTLRAAEQRNEASTAEYYGLRFLDFANDPDCRSLAEEAQRKFIRHAYLAAHFAPAELKTGDREPLTAEEEVYWDKAQAQYGSNDIEIDQESAVSIGQDGAFVRAWVFVENPDDDDDEPEEQGVVTEVL